jgi:hypothetical protein
MFQAWWPLECSKLGGHWNVSSLVAIGMFQAWWPLECFNLGGHWSVSILVAIGMFQVWWPMEGERKTPFHLFHFPPTNLLTPSIFFPFGLTVLLYHGPKSLLTPFFPFLRSINYDCAFNVTSPSHLHCQFDFD